MSSTRQAEGLRWASIRRTRGMVRASDNQATKRGYQHRVPETPARPAARPRRRLEQARPMTGRARLDSYGAATPAELTGPQRRRYNAKMNRQVNRTSGIARTLRGRERAERTALPQPAQPSESLTAAESRSLLSKINEIWRRPR
jgi:hypothetical protein